MPTYRVTMEIEVSAETKDDAAAIAIESAELIADTMPAIGQYIAIGWIIDPETEYQEHLCG
jgi:hypothetical protein